MEAYNADAIKVLDDVSHIRLRKGMYIGDGIDPSQLISEIIDNAIDEVQAGFSDKLEVFVNTTDNIYTVRDYGRGIPHGTKKLDNGEEKEILEVLATKANSGGKFDNRMYSVSSGLNGLGITVTNALSNYLELTSYRDGKFVKIHSEQGKNNILTKGDTTEKNGTLAVFQPDKTMFKTAKIPMNFIIERCRVASALGIKADLYIDGKPINTNATMFDLISEDEEAKISNYADIPIMEVTNKAKEKMKVALRYTSDTHDRYFGFTNLLINRMGGTHVQQLSKTISDAWIEFLDEHKNIKPAVELKRSDYLVGLRAVCAVFIAKPDFSSQTKEKLVVDKNYLNELMAQYKTNFIYQLESNIVLANQLVKRFEEYRQAQNALLSRKEISSIIKVNDDDENNIRRRSVVSKLIECTSKKRHGSELFICLSGDTRVKLLNGADTPIADLVGRTDVWAYSVNEKGQFVPTRIKRAFKTQEVNKLLELRFSDGSVIKCTPEHRFMDRDTLTWVEAQNLYIGESMLSVKTKIIDGYTHVWIPMEYTDKYSATRKNQGHWELLHRRIATQLGIVPAYDGTTKYNVHHKDFVRTNNDPDNLECLTFSEHFRLHALRNIEMGVCKKGFDNMSESSRDRMRNGVYKRTVEGIERQKEACRASWERDRHNPKRTWAHYNGSQKFWDDIAKNKDIRSAAAKEYWGSLTQEERDIAREKNRISTLRRKRIQCLHMGQELIEQGYELTSGNWKKYVWKNGLPSLEKAVEYFGSIEQFNEEIKNYNLKLVSIDVINTEDKVSVYCLEVENPFHAFVLGNGIVTHNCEGDSAAGPYQFVRDKETQAILPIRGKILNTTGKTVKDVIKNNEICDIANAIGCGIGDACDANKSRYDRIIISADADEDGKHINCLVLALFVNMFPDLVKSGRVFLSTPPLFYWHEGRNKFGSCQDVHEIPNTAKDATRCKGLGAMSDSAVSWFLVNKETRRLIQVEYPADINNFNKILGTSEGRNELLKDLGVIVTED